MARTSAGYLKVWFHRIVTRWSRAYCRTLSRDNGCGEMIILRKHQVNDLNSSELRLDFDSRGGVKFVARILASNFSCPPTTDWTTTITVKEDDVPRLAEMLTERSLGKQDGDPVESITSSLKRLVSRISDEEVWTFFTAAVRSWLIDSSIPFRSEQTMWGTGTAPGSCGPGRMGWPRPCFGCYFRRARLPC